MGMAWRGLASLPERLKLVPLYFSESCPPVAVGWKMSPFFFCIKDGYSMAGKNGTRRICAHNNEEIPPHEAVGESTEDPFPSWQLSLPEPLHKV